MDYQKLLRQFEYDTKGRWKSSTQQTRIKRLEQSILPYFIELGITLDKLSIQDIFEWQLYMCNVRKFKTDYINTLRSTLSVFLNYLVDINVLKENVITKTKSMKQYEPSEPFDYWEFDEFSEFIKYVNEKKFKVFFTFLYFTGCRVGEVRAVSWKQINFKTNKIYINRTVTPKPNKYGQFEYTLPKNNRTRYLMMNDALSDMLQGWKEVCKRQINFQESDLLFHRTNDMLPLSTTTIERKKNKFCEQAGIKQIRIHDFRHSNASLLINMGANVSVVSERLGHTDKTITLNRYTHFFPSMENNIINRIDNLTGLFLDNHTIFAKAVIEFLNTAKELKELNAKEKEIIDLLEKKIWG